jgi:hypothetical protein
MKLNLDLEIDREKLGEWGRWLGREGWGTKREITDLSELLTDMIEEITNQEKQIKVINERLGIKE